MDYPSSSCLEVSMHAGIDHEVHEEWFLGPRGKFKKKLWALKGDLTPIPYNLFLWDDVDMANAADFVEKSLVGRHHGLKFSLEILVALCDQYISPMVSDPPYVFLFAKGWIQLSSNSEDVVCITRMCGLLIPRQSFLNFGNLFLMLTRSIWMKSMREFSFLVSLLICGIPRASQTWGINLLIF